MSTIVGRRKQTKFTYYVGDFVLKATCECVDHDVAYSCLIRKLTVDGEKTQLVRQGGRKVFLSKDHVFKIDVSVLSSQRRMIREKEREKYNFSAPVGQNKREADTLCKIEEEEDRKHFPRFVALTEHSEILIVTRLKGIRFPGYDEERKLNDINLRRVRDLCSKYNISDMGHTSENRYRNWAMKGKYPVLLDLGRGH